MNQQHDLMNRRRLLERAGRWTAFGVIGVGVGAMAARRQLSQVPCDRDHVCRGCALISGCGLPQALSFRVETQRESA